MATNVDKELHNPETTNGNLIKERSTSKPKRSLRGAAGGTYIGPVLSTAAGGDAADGSSYSSGVTHGTGAAGGGTEDSTGYRSSDLWRVGTAEDAATATVRPNPGNTTYGGRNAYRANGIQGGSVRGYPAQRTGQKSVASTGDSLTAEGGAAAFMDKRSNVYGDGGLALGSSGRGSRVINGVVHLSGATAQREGTAGHPFMDVRPTIVGADPSAGEVEIVDGTGGAVHADLNAADITGGASNYAGCVIYCFARDTDTDEDAGLVRKGDFDTVMQGAVTGMGGLTAGTYAFYAAFKDAAGNVGPWSARSTLAIT